MNTEAVERGRQPRPISLGKHIGEFVSTVNYFQKTDPNKLDFSHLENTAPHLSIRETRLAYRISELIPKKK
ncbi:MAG: hypothetical protein V1917_01970 [Candidatus Gottesmanbacteria bacterium]